MLCLVIVAVGIGSYWSSSIEKALNFLIYNNDGGTAVVFDSGLAVHFIDVGQADAICIELPGGGAVMVDTGKKNTTAKLGEYLTSYIFKENRPKVFEHFILTHSDEDHVGGAKWLLGEYTVESFHRPKSFTLGEIQQIAAGQTVGSVLFDKTKVYTLHNTVGYNDYINAMNAQISKGSTVDFNGVGKFLELGNDTVRLDWLGPFKDYYGTRTTQSTTSNDSAHAINAQSPIVLLTYKSKRIVLTGDAVVENETEALNAGKLNFTADVLKLGHHGSKTSSCIEFLTALKPTYVVISVGEKSIYGHPSDSVLESVAAIGVRADRVFSTFANGNIIAAVDETGQISVTSGVPNDVFWVTYWQLATGLVVIIFAALFTNEIVRFSRKKR